MANKHYKRLIEFLEGPAGYTFDRKGSKGGHVYKNKALQHHRLGIVKITPTIHDNDALNFIHNISRELGLETPKDGSKRNGQQVKDRQAKDRDHARAELQREKRELYALVEKREEEYRYRLKLREFRNSQLDGHAVALTDAQITDISKLIAEKEQAILEWQKLLAMPTGGSNRYVA
jgi:hypothetical protein